MKCPALRQQEHILYFCGSADLYSGYIIRCGDDAEKTTLPGDR